MKILIADDSELIRNGLRKLLKSISSDIGISEAKSYSETLEEFQNYKPDIIILDINLPDGNGIDLLKEIKKTNPNQIVMLLTNFPTEINRNKCLAEGADFFFDKSKDIDLVYSTISDILTGFLTN